MKIKKILVSQPKPQTEKSPYYDIAAKYGVEVVFRPFIKVEGLSFKEFMSQKVEVLNYTAIIFTARTAIDHFFRLSHEMRINIPEDMKYFCISESVALYLQKYIQYRKRKIFFSPTGKFQDLIPAIKKHSNEKYLMAVADVNKDNNVSLLIENNITFTKAAFYKTVSNDFAPDEPFDYDMLVFFSPEGINSLLKNFPNFEQGDTIIATFGTTTAKAVTDAGLRLDLSAPNAAAPSMTGAIDLYFKENKVNKK
ncbi:MAG: uroporphyrinogen-III synthase [Paludibacteraceae bacterium]|nr:uroporphyrinogen-III synthase [Paludibacteraceae bacterium]MBQ6766866.1 uroporphyrinogen-III synthase [Paludibacteraceae bacterium]MDY6373143.1 uroporphyrinogen-III synthase [Bacteroidales bacterium]MDY6427007.1 uroporphyrinogen-III synthase [Bacteroidales bacterium]